MSVVEHGIAEAPLHGYERSGDHAVVLDFAGGALIAAIDGLGHGDEANAASREAGRVLEAAPDASIEELVTRCHERLRDTRGAAMSLARIDARASTLTWLGVGNVEGLLVRALPVAPEVDASLVCRGGIVGYRLPTLHARKLALHPADTIVLATDGIKPGFREEVTRVRDVEQIAHHIVAHFASRKDDACVVVARYRGERPEGTRVDIDGEAGVAEARIRARDHARALGFSAADVEALATAVSELARNIVDHAKTGDVLLVRMRDGARAGLAVIARDRGPGIADIQLALQDGFSTARGLGSGLPGARRLVDDLQVETEVGVGTIVTIKKWLR